MKLYKIKWYDDTTESRQTGNYVASEWFFKYIFALDMKENSEWWKVKYFWKVTEWLTFAEIMLASSKMYWTCIFHKKNKFYVQMLKNIDIQTTFSVNEESIINDMMKMYTQYDCVFYINLPF